MDINVIDDTSSRRNQIIRLILSIFGVYTSFLLWGYLQERLSSTDYSYSATLSDSERIGLGLDSKVPARWTSMVVLNVCMAFMSAATAAPFVLYQNMYRKNEPMSMSMSLMAVQTGLMPAALSNCLASPFGYLSLRFINYPMLLLAKSSKLVPVMLLSYIINGKRYSMTQILSVTLISIGVALFSCKTNPVLMFLSNDSNYMNSSSMSNKISLDESSTSTRTSIGLILVLINLLLDGFTNARQDKFKEERPKTSSFTMMYQMNILQVILLSSFLVTEFVITKSFGLSVGITSSQVEDALRFVIQFPTVLRDITLFCITGATGQVFVYYIITEFGSVMCVLITVTRKFFSILLSVVMFGHEVQIWQWVGVLSVFTGLVTNSLDRYYSKRQEKIKRE